MDKMKWAMRATGIFLMAWMLAMALEAETASAATYISGIDGNSYVNTTNFYGNLNWSYIQNFPGSATSLYAGGKYMYNDSTKIYLNDTYANTTFATINSSKWINNANISCSNITGTATDLCTITPGAGGGHTGTGYLYNDSTQMHFNDTLGNATYATINSSKWINNANISCSNISGASTNLCTISTAGSLTGGNPFLYNDSTQIFFNLTYAYGMYATYNSSKLINNTNISCYNISGAASNLCTITDTDTNAGTLCSGTTTYLDGEGNCDDISGVYWDACADAYTCNWITGADVPANEDDPQVDSITTAKWCRGDALGTAIDCDADDPTLTAGNATIDVTGGKIYANMTYLDIYYLRTSGFNAANITSGTIAFARLPTLTDTHTHNASNITSGTFGGNYTFSGNSSFTANVSISRLHATDVNTTNVNATNGRITTLNGTTINGTSLAGGTLNVTTANATIIYAGTTNTSYLNISVNGTAAGNFTIINRLCLNLNCSSYIRYNATDNFVYII